MGILKNIKTDLDQGALQLVIECRERLYAVAFRECGNVADADDLVSRALAKAILKLNGDTEVENLFGWLKTLMLNLRADDMRKAVVRGTEPVDPKDIEAAAGADWSTDEQILKDSDSEAIRLALDELDPKYRQAMLMRYYDDFSLKEIADILRLPMGTVSRRIQIAHRLLAGKLGAKLGKTKKPLAVLAAVLLAAGAVFGITKAVEWVQGGDGGESAAVSAAVVADPTGSCADSVAAQREIGVQISQQKEKTNMKAKQVVAAAIGTAALFGVGAGMEVRADEPVTYTEVEYIQTLDNDSWFDTGVKATDAYGIRVKLMPMQQTPEWRSLVSSHLDDFTFGFYNDLHLYYLRRRGAAITSSGVLSSDEPTVLELESNGQSLGLYYTIVLFNNSEHSRGSLLRIYECEIFGSDGNPILQLQPYVRTQGGVSQNGFRDKLTGLFISNGGAGATEAGPVVVKTDLLSVKGEPAELGEVSPAYGSHRGYSVGQSVPCTAPANWTSGDGRTRATCVGYKVYTNELLYVEGSANSFTYVHPDCVAGVELVWQWSREYKVTATAGEGGTVTPDEQWVAEGASATIEAKADEDCSFARWTGDRSGSDNPACFADVRSPLALTASFASAISVAIDGSDAADGTAASPFKTVAHALEVASERARATSSTVSVKVGPGTFFLEKELVVSDAIRLVGAGRDLTILDGQKKCRVLNIQHVDATVSDFTITNGKTPSYQSGGGVTMSAGTLCRCLVTGNSAAEGGGGINITGMNQKVFDCIVSNNTANTGGGIYVSYGSVDNSLVCANTARGSGGGCFFAGANVSFCTIAGNMAATRCGGVFYMPKNGSGSAHDNIIWGNSASEDADVNTGDGALAHWTNNCASVAAGECPQTADPLFKNAVKHDYRLKGSSPYRDAAWGVPTSGTDILGNPRVQGARADLGAFESDPVEKSANMECEVSGGLDTATVWLTAKATNFDINAAECYWTFDGRTPTETNYDATGVELTYDYTNMGPCSVAMTVIYDGEEFVDVKENFITVSPSVVYVDANSASPAAPYNTRETAATGLGEAVEAAAQSGTTILVAPGTYVLTAPVTVQKSVAVRSEEGPDVTVFDGDGKVSLLKASVAGIEIAGFTFANGGGSEPAVRVEAGVLTNCVVRNNLKGGVYLTDRGLVTGCVISNNTTTANGGGVYLYGGTLENSLVCGNSATAAGGVYFQGGLVRFCTVAGNSATSGGGVFWGSSNWPDAAHDNIVWGNAASSFADINVEGAGRTMWTNNCSSVAVGVSPRTADPIFRNAAKRDYRLAGSSPYRDAAWGVPAATTDVFGNPRVQNGRADLGAIESDPNEKSANMEIVASGRLDAATVTLTAKATNFDIADAVCYWTFDGRTPTAANHDAVGAVVSHDYGLGSCSAALAVVSGGETFLDVQDNFLTVSPSRLYFDSHNAQSAYPYNTLETAASNLVEAIAAASDQGGSTVLVRPGTHVLTETVTVQKPVRIRGEKGPSVTALDGDGKISLLNVLADGAEVSDIAIANGGGAGEPAVRLEKGVLTNCVVRNSSSGGISLMYDGLVTGCVISNNMASGVGGGVSTCGGTLENSLVCGNTAANGGGVYVYHGTTVRFCTIVNNTATGIGGGVFCAAADWGDMGHDNIIWGNEAPVSPDINTKDVVYLANWRNICSSVRVGENTSERELVANPYFQNEGKGDYRLRFQSPCRNAAWGSLPSSVDLDGAPRVRFRFPDIGCYECQFGSGLMLQVK